MEKNQWTTISLPKRMVDQIDKAIPPRQRVNQVEYLLKFHAVVKREYPEVYKKLSFLLN